MDTVRVANNYIPNERINFVSINPNVDLVKTIQRMNPKSIAKAFKYNDASALNSLYLDSFVCSMINGGNGEVVKFWDDVVFIENFRPGSVRWKEENKPSSSTAEKKKEDVAEQVPENMPATDTKEPQNDAWQQTPAGKIICEIDGLLEQGFRFDNISCERWESVYREECVKILSSKYTVTEEQSEKMIEILDALKNNMFNPNERNHVLQADAAIDALNRFLKIDGVVDGFTTKTMDSEK